MTLHTNAGGGGGICALFFTLFLFISVYFSLFELNSSKLIDGKFEEIFSLIFNKIIKNNDKS